MVDLLTAGGSFLSFSRTEVRGGPAFSSLVQLRCCSSRTRSIKPFKTAGWLFIVQRPPTPEEILENQQLRDQLYAAVMELPDKQAKWIYARFYLGMTVKEIAQAESIDPSWVYKSIKRGLKHLAKKFEKV